MDVRCERCRVQYVFGEDQVGPDGLTVRCSNCGHVFLVKKKALVVTVPVKPGELREAPVPTADLNRSAPAQNAAPRPTAEKVRPWSLRNRRGDLYPFKDLSTLQKWIVERKASRDDEVSHVGGPWRRLGDMLELEPFFALVERAERGATPASLRADRASAAPPASRGKGAQPTLIDFPAPRPASSGPGGQPASTGTDRFPIAAGGKGAVAPDPAAQSTVVLGSPPPAAADEGPVVAGAMAPVEASEPAWTASAGEQPVERPAEAAPPARPRKRGSLIPVVLVLAVAAAGAGVYVARPGWLALLAPGGQPARPEADRTAAAPSPPAEGEPAPPARPEKAAGSPEAPIPGTPLAKPQAVTPAAPGAGASSAASAGEPSQPREPSHPPAEPSGSAAPAPGRSEARPGVLRGERGQESSATPPNTASIAPSTANPTPAPAAGENAPTPPQAEKPTTPSVDEKSPSIAGAPPPHPAERTAPAVETPKHAPPQLAEPAPKRAAAAQRPEPEKPTSLQRLLADARRLRVRGKPEAALKVYGRALEAEPANADALAGRGLCYLDLSQYGPAEASFQAALEADARNAEALMGLAETYRYEGRRTEAVTYYQKYVAAHPRGEDAAAARNAIDALKE